MKPVVWLASYPKCGNTWFRLLLANLGRHEPVDINAMDLEGGIASARARFDNTFQFASGLLSHEECDGLRPELYRALAEGTAGAAGTDGADDGRDSGPGGLRFVKTHDAWTMAPTGEPLLGGRAAARGAILIVRDPRDVVASLANHNGQTLDEAIAFMADPASAFAGRRDRQPRQLRQQLLGWSGFCRSWLDQRDVPVHLVRYEDMQCATAAELGRALAFAGVDAPPSACEKAAELSAFDKARAQEAEAGFGEAPARMNEGRFFRSGRVGGWRSELAPEQCRRVEADHAEMMERLGYAPERAAASHG
jgi:hypothetical protein